MASGHICPSGSRPVGVMAWPPFADPGSVVRVAGTESEGDTGIYGRVRFAWRCCGTAVVEFLPDSETADTYSTRYPLGELLPPVPEVSYSIPCIGAAWSLHLPCGHVAGEGCDCELIALEAEAV